MRVTDSTSRGRRNTFSSGSLRSVAKGTSSARPLRVRPTKVSFSGLLMPPTAATASRIL